MIKYLQGVVAATLVLGVALAGPPALAQSKATTLVYGNTAGPELRLITCGGTVAESTGRFVDNVIVFAREV